MFGDLYDRLNKIKLTPLTEQLIELLQCTWASIAIDECISIASHRRPTEQISRDDLARIELTSDDVRSSVFCNVCRWQGTNKQKLLDEWFDLSLNEQNALLIEAFPDGQVYGV